MHGRVQVSYVPIHLDCHHVRLHVSDRLSKSHPRHFRQIHQNWQLLHPRPAVSRLEDTSNPRPHGVSPTCSVNINERVFPPKEGQDLSPSLTDPAADARPRHGDGGRLRHGLLPVSAGLLQHLPALLGGGGFPPRPHAEGSSRACFGRPVCEHHAGHLYFE